MAKVAWRKRWVAVAVISYATGNEFAQAADSAAADALKSRVKDVVGNMTTVAAVVAALAYVSAFNSTTSSSTSDAASAGLYLYGTATVFSLVTVVINTSLVAQLATTQSSLRVLMETNLLWGRMLQLSIFVFGISVYTMLGGVISSVCLLYTESVSTVASSTFTLMAAVPVVAWLCFTRMFNMQVNTQTVEQVLQEVAAHHFEWHKRFGEWLNDDGDDGWVWVDRVVDFVLLV